MSDLPVLSAKTLFEGFDSHHDFTDDLIGTHAGRVVITFDDAADHARNRSVVLALLSSLGMVLSVYPSVGPWSDLAVRTDVDPGRTHGVGENRLHIDMVDREHTPRFIALYCVRDDPGGGGASALADMWPAIESLRRDDRRVLEQPAYRYWTDEGVHGVGESLRSFPIVPSRLDWGVPVRFTSKMGPHLDNGELVDTGLVPAEKAAAAFGRLRGAVEAQRITYRLRPGQLLVWDQRRYAHGRMPLRIDQDQIPENTRRLLHQTYVMDRRPR
ncbi:TauD/TfdA family dioxygenase [Asanoa iriomotensis]|uniref:TauD/TfdA-like domain-containing protein n=1 Tax=Asanoa iriomotensis TaxID=234613 RepID=A0ABQ4C5F2_9ACTN|nr:TauD/TfdA family dioxygenase [Asanoa iriomotensis]GIF58006.1 hypothetical protein Air01nite_41010 [Asanoa iriomotensis]